MDGPDERTALWPDRHLTRGRLLIERGPAPAPAWPFGRRLLDQAGRWWASLQPWHRGGLSVLVAVGAGAPFRSIDPVLAGGMSLITLLAIGVLLLARPRPVPVHPDLTEATLAAGDTTEARVAAAATRAWRETVEEPAWNSPYLVRSRAAFDGQAQVDHIIDVALDIFATRVRLGVRPRDASVEYWERQQAALERTAEQLGERADALIRYRDGAAQLSAQLARLAVLEDLESAALDIADLAVRSAPAGYEDDGGLGAVADEIVAVHAAMTDLVDLMTDTLSPAVTAGPGVAG
jgi:hypothetical protein